MDIYKFINLHNSLKRYALKNNRGFYHESHTAYTSKYDKYSEFGEELSAIQHTVSMDINISNKPEETDADFDNLKSGNRCVVVSIECSYIEAQERVLDNSFTWAITVRDRLKPSPVLERDVYYFNVEPDGRVIKHTQVKPPNELFNVIESIFQNNAPIFFK